MDLRKPFLVNKREAARLLAVSTRAIDSLVQSGELEVRRVAKQDLFSLSMLEQFAETGNKEIKFHYETHTDNSIAGRVEVDDGEIPVSGYVVDGPCCMHVMAGTTGVRRHSGDWGHGARAVLLFLQMEGVGFFVERSEDHLAIVFGGEYEVRAFATALRFAANAIEAELKLESLESEEPNVNKNN